MSSRNQKEYKDFLDGLKKVDPDLAKFILERLGRDPKNFTHLRGRLRYADNIAYQALVSAAKIGRVSRTDAAKKLGPCNKRKIVKLRRDLWGMCEDIETFYSCKTGFMAEEGPRDYTVYFKGEEAPGDVDKEIVAIEDEIAHEYKGIRKWSFGFNNRVAVCSLTPAQAKKLSQNDRIEKVVQEEIATIQYGEYAPQPPFDPAAENVDWGVTKLNVSYAWDKGIKGAGVKLCILDTGCESGHIDLVDRYKGGYNFVFPSDPPLDDHGHGTHCAGIALASDTGVGYIGVAPEADLYAVKILNSKGCGSFSTIAAGVDWCRVNKMDIISMSIGGDMSCEGAMAQSLLDAWNAGIVNVAAAGNEGDEPGCLEPDETCVSMPGNCPTTITVGSLQIDEYLSGYSSRGPEMEVVAPGEGITSAKLTDKNMYGEDAVHRLVGSSWMWASGTSMACPHVAGACALIKCWFPDATNYQIRGWLREYARDL